jgi:hypothetical protein
VSVEELHPFLKEALKAIGVDYSPEDCAIYMAAVS